MMGIVPSAPWQGQGDRRPQSSTWAARAVQTGVAAVVGGFAALVPLSLVPLALVGLALVPFAILRPRRFATAAITLSMLPLPSAAFGLDSRVALALLLSLGGAVEVFRQRLGIQARLLVLTGLLATTLLISFVRTMDVPTVLVREHDLILFLVGLAVLVLFAVLRLSLTDILHSIALGGLATAVLVLIGSDVSHDGRLTGLALNPNFLGLLLGTTLVALAGMPLPVLAAPRLSSELLRWIGAGVVTLALVLTQSRGAVLAAGVGLIVLFTAKLRPRWQAAAVVAAAVLILTVPGLTDAVVSGGVNRPHEELASNNSVRLNAARLAVRYAVDHPLAGVGYGTFPDRARSDSYLGVYINTHNDYLRLAAEAGLPAVVVFMCLIFPVTRAPRNSRAGRTAFALAVAYLVGLVFANSLTNLQVSMPFWAVLGSIWATQKSSVQVPRASQRAA